MDNSNAHTAGQPLQDGLNRITQSTDTGLAMANLWVERNTISLWHILQPHSTHWRCFLGVNAISLRMLAQSNSLISLTSLYPSQRGLFLPGSHQCPPLASNTSSKRSASNRRSFHRSNYSRGASCNRVSTQSGSSPKRRVNNRRKTRISPCCKLYCKPCCIPFLIPSRSTLAA
jgi:hypothetical protein